MVGALLSSLAGVNGEMALFMLFGQHRQHFQYVSFPGTLLWLSILIFSGVMLACLVCVP